MKKNLLIVLILLNACTANGLLNDLTRENPIDTTPFFPADRAYVFVSSQTTAGDMSGLTAGGCSGGGPAQADCACTAMARVANLLRRRDSRFVAWLSTATDDASCRLLGVGGKACPITSGGEPWYLTDNVLIINGLAGITPTTGQLKKDENNILTASSLTFTGTGGNGLAIGGDCNTWTSSSSLVTATGGSTGGNNASAWTQSNSGASALTCDTLQSVYCFALP